MRRWLCSQALLRGVVCLVILLPLACCRDELGFSQDEGKTGSSKDILQLSTMVSLPATSTSFSVCCHFNLRFVRGERTVLLTLYPVGGIAMMQKELYVMEGYTKTYSVKNYKVPLRQWVHICISFYGGIRIFLDGQQMQTSVMVELSPPVFKTGDHPLIIGKLLEFPSDLDAENVFWMSIPVLVPRKVSKEEADQLLQCGSVLEGNLVTNKWEEIVYLRSINVMLRRNVATNDATDVLKPNWTAYNSSYKMPPSPPPPIDVIAIKPCSAETELHLLGIGVFNFEQASQFCRKFNGSLPAPTHPSLAKTVEQVYNSEKDVTFWKNDRFENNSCLLSARNSEEYMDFYMECSSLIGRHLICEISPTTTFYALGHETENFSPLYLDKCGGVLSCFYTIDRDKVVLSDDGADYQFKTYKKTTMMTAPAEELSVPVGKFIVRMEATGMVAEAIISSCAEEEFTCNDGFCIPLTQHCDGVGQCELYEDENCQQNVLFPSNYDDTRPPQLGLPVQLVVRIGKISDVDISNGRVTMQMELLTSWDDDRLLFVQLEDELKKNQISDQIWYPKYEFSPLIFDDEISYFRGNNTISGFYAQRIAAGNLMTLGTQRKRVFEAVIIHTEQVSFTFLCDFDLLIYPFGTYPCQYTISLQADSATDPYFDLNTTSVELTSQSLSLFVARYSAFTAPTNSTDTPRTITITVLLEGRFGGFILSIFMPCTVITFIGISTLFYAFDNFQDRITVTLSCLIVEAGLYSQVTDIVPISAAPKFIDVFFFYAITRLFFTCMNHVFTYRFLIWLDHRRAKTSDNPSQQARTTSGARAPGSSHRVSSSSVKHTKERGNITNDEPNYKSSVKSTALKKSIVAWEGEKDDEKELQRRYRTFKHLYYISVVLSFACDTFSFLGSAYLIYLNWNAVFEEHPSLMKSP